MAALQLMEAYRSGTNSQADWNIAEQAREQEEEKGLIYRLHRVKECNSYFIFSPRPLSNFGLILGAS